MSQNQLSTYDFKTENMVFSKPEIGSIPGQKINFKRVRLACRNLDGSIGDLIFSTPERIHTFGLQESRDLTSNKLNGYVLPLCLWGRNGPSENEKKFTDVFSLVSDHCKQYLLEHREDIEKYDLDMSDLKKFNPLFWKMDKGKPVEGKGPMLYSKVIMNKKNNKISTIFVDEATNKEIDPFTILNKPCSVTAALKFESIFVGNKISLQVKLYEVVVRLIESNSMRGLLRPNAGKIEVPDLAVTAPASATVGKSLEVNIYNSLGHEDDEDDDEQDEEVDKNEEDEEEEDDDDGSIVVEESSKSVEPPAPSVATTTTTAAVTESSSSATDAAGAKKRAPARRAATAKK
jgi:hypothetical protein